MERKISETFDYGSKKLCVVEDIGCQSCYFNNFCDDNRDVLVTGACSGYMRSDCKSVIFKEVEK